MVLSDVIKTINIAINQIWVRELLRKKNYLHVRDSL